MLRLHGIHRKLSLPITERLADEELQPPNESLHDARASGVCCGNGEWMEYLYRVLTHSIEKVHLAVCFNLYLVNTNVICHLFVQI